MCTLNYCWSFCPTGSHWFHYLYIDRSISLSVYPFIQLVWSYSTAAAQHRDSSCVFMVCAFKCWWEASTFKTSVDHQTAFFFFFLVQEDAKFAWLFSQWPGFRVICSSLSDFPTFFARAFTQVPICQIGCWNKGWVIRRNSNTMVFFTAYLNINIVVIMTIIYW